MVLNSLVGFSVGASLFATGAGTKLAEEIILDGASSEQNYFDDPGAYSARIAILKESERLTGIKA
jgi:hypothetical protein